VSGHGYRGQYPGIVGKPAPTLGHILGEINVIEEHQTARPEALQHKFELGEHECTRVDGIDKSDVDAGRVSDDRMDVVFERSFS